MFRFYAWFAALGLPLSPYSLLDTYVDLPSSAGRPESQCPTHPSPLALSMRSE